MKEKYCELLFGFDCGSVAETQTEQAIKAFKKFISAQKKLDGEANITGVSFNHRIQFVYDNKPIKKITAKDYKFDMSDGRGECHMLDAVSMLMNNVGERLSNTPEDERPSQVVVIINIFGRDNASKKCTHDRLREMIALQRDVYKWKFILATDYTINMEKLGINPDDTIVIKRDSDDMFGTAYAQINEMVTKIRNNM